MTAVPVFSALTVVGGEPHSTSEPFPPGYIAAAVLGSVAGFALLCVGLYVAYFKFIAGTEPAGSTKIEMVDLEIEVVDEEPIVFETTDSTNAKV